MVCQNKIFKKYGSSFINYDRLDKEKQSFYNEYSNNEYSTSLTPLYKYSPKYSDVLIFKTEFIDLTVNPFKWMNIWSDKKHQTIKSHIIVDVNNPSMQHLHKIFKDIDDLAIQAINKKFGYGNCFNYISSLSKHIENDHNHSYIKLFFLENKYTNTIKTEVYNYNKSSKYKRVEHYNSLKLDEISRFLYKGKQVRFLLMPTFWHWGNRFGTKLYIKLMEVKYKDATIASELKNRQIEMKEKISSIEI
ncbi:MAG: hypothetical protein GTN70_09375 [Deltaproteobacteria bacterium]|nr:hypothetical protein [Deltaproteobacteria bacterium]